MEITNQILGEQLSDFLIDRLNKAKVSLNHKNISKLNNQMSKEYAELKKTIGSIQAKDKLATRYSSAIKYLFNVFNERGNLDSIEFDNIDKGIINLINDYKNITR